MRKREKLFAMLPNIAVSKCQCYSCVDNSPQHYSVFCVRTAAATCCRLQEPDDIVPPDTSYEDGVTTATVCRVLTGWQLTCGPWLVWVHWVPGRSSPDAGTRRRHQHGQQWDPTVTGDFAWPDPGHQHECFRFPWELSNVIYNLQILMIVWAVDQWCWATFIVDDGRYHRW